MKSYLPKHQRTTATKSNKKTLRCLRPVMDKINVSKLCRDIGVPKGTFKGWLKRGDNMIETKNHISSDYRKQAFQDMRRELIKLRDELDDIIAYSALD